MTGGRSPRITKAEQSGRFIETARAIGADEDEAAFKAKLAVIARQKPKGDPYPTKKARHIKPSD
jgi:hypothetical protein